MEGGARECQWWWGPPRGAPKRGRLALPAMSALRVFAPVATALAAGRPVVALESSVLAQGLPIPANREAAERMVAGVERSGALAAIASVVRGERHASATLGIDHDELERFLAREGVRKVAARDLAVACAQND